MHATTPPELVSRRRLALLVVGSTLVVLAACAAEARVSSLDAPIPTGMSAVTSPVTAPSTSPTTSPPSTVPPTSAPAVAPTTIVPAAAPPVAPGDGDGVLEVGDSGAEVAELQQRLVDLGYHLPGVDGEFGELTQQAVLAFQKGEGLGRDGVAGPVTRTALESAEPLAPREGGDHVEIDIDRQLLFVVHDGRTIIFNTSTGAEGMETPAGRFVVDREIDGMRYAPLGQLWRPKYFNGGIALHGSGSIPGYPASHGCARLHNSVIDLIWSEDLVPIGTPVWVY